MQLLRRGRLPVRPDYLHLRMRPLSAGAVEPTRPLRGRYWGAVIAVLALAAVVALISRLPLPDQDARLGTAYVVHADEGFTVGVRGCAGTTIRHVEVRVDGEDPVVWSATAGTGETGRSELPLFQNSPGFTTAGAVPTPVSGSYDVDVGTGVVFDTSLPRTLVAYPGSEQPVTMDQYLALSDSQFDC